VPRLSREGRAPRLTDHPSFGSASSAFRASVMPPDGELVRRIFPQTPDCQAALFKVS